MSPEPGSAQRVRQPKCFDDFRCIGAACEDTCCTGWGVVVDQATYDKYQNPRADQAAGRVLSSLVEINPARSNPGNYAKMRMDDQATCPALHQGACSIQQTLGEPYIPDLCSTYPRVLTVTGGVVERSLHLSCPEAARLALGDVDAMVFHERTEATLPHRPGSVAVIAGETDDRLYRVRTLLAEVIRERSVPLWQRVASIGMVVGRLADADAASAVAVLGEHLKKLRQGQLREALTSPRNNPAFQLETVLDLVVGRIGSDYTGPRFLQCYADFMRGLAWTGESTMEELAARYSNSARLYFQPFVERHEHMLENFLISCIFRTVFPYGRRMPDQRVAVDAGESSLRENFFLLSVHYAIVRTLLIGIAALHRGLTVEEVIRLVQSYAKAFLHSTSFEKTVLEYIGKNFADPAVGIALLVMD